MNNPKHRLLIILLVPFLLQNCKSKQEDVKIKTTSSNVDSTKNYIKSQNHKNGVRYKREYYINDSLSGWTSEFDSIGNLIYQSKYIELKDKYQSNEWLNFGADGSIVRETSLFFDYPNVVNNMIFNGEQVHVCVSNPEFDSSYIVYKIYSSGKEIRSDSTGFDNCCFYFKTADLKPGKYLIKANVALVNRNFKAEYERHENMKLKNSATVFKTMRKVLDKKIQILDEANFYKLKE